MADNIAVPFNINDSSNASITAIAADSARHLEVRKLFISINTTDTITIYWGSRLVWGPFYLTAGSGLAVDFDDYTFRGFMGEALIIEKGSATTPITVCGLYTGE